MGLPAHPARLPRWRRHAPSRLLSSRPGPDPSTTVLDDGSVLHGGAARSGSSRVSSPRRQRSLAQWAAGARVGQRRGRQLLARRLVSSGTFNPRPSESSHGPGDVTVVIPVRNRADQLQRLLSLLDGLSCVVVDDASSDPARTETIAQSFGARFIGLTANAGPSGARNARLDIVSTPLVAFVDSDCEPTADWLSPLLGHFDDPMVAAVAPRIVPTPVSPPTWLSRYEAVRSSLDRGEREGLVRPHTAIPYVPSATIVVRRRVAGTSLFDPTLRGGEDVDLVWRLVAAGWDVRYVPTSTVAHAGPDTARSWMTRRVFYGTTAGPLSRRHPEALVPLRTSAWSAATWGLLAARRPVLAAGTLAAPTAHARPAAGVAWSMSRCPGGDSDRRRRHGTISAPRPLGSDPGLVPRLGPGLALWAHSSCGRAGADRPRPQRFGVDARRPRSRALHRPPRRR